MKKVNKLIFILVIILSMTCVNVFAFDGTGVNENLKINKNVIDKEEKLAKAEDEKINQWLQNQITPLTTGTFLYLVDVTNLLRKLVFGVGQLQLNKL